LDLPAPVRAEEAPELLRAGPSPPLGLSLKGAERLEFALGLDDPFHVGDAERADQLILQISDAYKETESFHVGACQRGAETGPLEPAPEVALLSGVTEARESEVQPLGTVPIEEASDVGRTPHRHDRHTLRIEISAAAPCERFERELVTGPLNQHDGAWAPAALLREIKVDGDVIRRIGHLPTIGDLQQRPRCFSLPA